MTRAPLKHVEVHGAAKVNIGWTVGAKRPDGYHEVRGLMQTISLADRLEISVREGVGLRLLVPGHPELEDDSNLVLLAARLVAARVDVAPATTIVVHKSIPVAAGLGGGSADAAAALVGLNAAWGAGLSAKQLLDLAAGIGSDVPAILVGGLVHASGRGERVRNVGSFDAGRLVIGVGAERVSAASAYAKLDDIARPDGLMLHDNDLEMAACALVGGLEDRIATMRAATSVAFVSGSGPTVIGVVADESSAHAAADQVRHSFKEVLIAHPVPWGVRLTLGT